MDRERTEAEGDVAQPRHRRQFLRVVLVVLLSLFVAVATILAWQLASGQPARARSATVPGAPGAKKPGRTVSAPVSSSGSAPTGPGAGSSPPPVSAPTTTTTTSAAPLRVLEIGDSLGVDLGIAMQNLFSPTRVQLTMAARSDTGLSNSGFYDWPRVLAGLLASARPQVVIVLLGANDLQSIVTGSTVLADGTPAWNAAYAARVTSIISESVRAGARVLWIGEPAMQDPFLDAGMTRLDGIAQEVVARYPGDSAYLASDATLAPGGSFAAAVTGPTGGQVQVRTPDGVHLTATGSDMLADAVAGALANAWGMQVLGQ